MAQTYRFQYSDFSAPDQQEILAVDEDIGRIGSLENLMARTLPLRNIVAQRGDYLVIENIPQVNRGRPDEIGTRDAFVMGVNPLTLAIPEFEEGYGSQIIPLTVPIDVPPDHWNEELLRRYEGYHVAVEFDRELDANDLYTLLGPDGKNWIILPAQANETVYYYAAHQPDQGRPDENAHAFFGMLRDPPVIGRPLDLPLLPLPRSRVIDLGPLRY